MRRWFKRSFFKTALSKVRPASEILGPPDFEALPTPPPYDPRPVAKRNLEDVRQRFTNDVAEHTMHVLHEDGVYRHLRFKAPGTMMYHFDLITWPGHLSIQGDMGGYTFKRTNDMFTFFRTAGDINPYYWGEKLQNGSESGRRPVMKYSAELVEERLKQAYDDWVEDNKVDADDVRLNFADQEDFDAWLKHAEEVWTSIHFRILDHTEDEREVHQALNDYEHSGKDNHIGLYDAWEWEFADFDYHFLWCCFAVQWGVRTYDAARPTIVTPEKERK